MDSEARRSKVEPYYPGSHVDVLIVGAGISGISAAYHLQTRCPNKSYAILEARETMGGTWDLFRYPGVRSDSDMYTLGFSFRPWTGDQSIADGSAILQYLQTTAEAYGIDQKLHRRHRVISASWRSADNRWTVIFSRPDATQAELTCAFLYLGTGYYDYDSGFTPEWPGFKTFGGTLVHPQHWPENLDVTGKKVIVIGSGATAVTLVPELAKSAAQVTMLQRSPTYIVALPARDAIAGWLRRQLPLRVAYRLTRWKNILLGAFFYQFARRYPDAMIRRVLQGVRAQLGSTYDIATHFTPRYKPWDQRLCLAPDGDLFDAIRRKRATVETGDIKQFFEHGIEMNSGKTLAADIIVTATGLQLKMMGGIAINVDGRAIEPSKAMLYRGMLLSDVPNLAVAVGYTNASWTLKCELTARYVCRLLNWMDARGYARCVARRDNSQIASPVIDFTSGYIQRAQDILPLQGDRKPWRLRQNYLIDLASLHYGRLADGTLEFGRAT